MSKTCNLNEVMHIWCPSPPKFHVSPSSGSTTPKHSHKYAYLHISSFSVFLFYGVHKYIISTSFACIYNIKNVNLNNHVFITTVSVTKSNYSINIFRSFPIPKLKLVLLACNTDTTPTQPHRISNTHRTKNNKTNVVIQQNSRKLLMMNILMSETCWAHKKWNKIASENKFTSPTYCVCTVLKYSWWWTVGLSETCRVCYEINLRNSASRRLSL